MKEIAEGHLYKTRNGCVAFVETIVYDCSSAWWPVEGYLIELYKKTETEFSWTINGKDQYETEKESPNDIVSYLGTPEEFPEYFL